MNWHAGDIALLVDDGNVIQKYMHCVGCLCTLTHYRGPDPVKPAWDVNIDGAMFIADETALRKPYDGNELCEWEDMKDIFIPRELVVTT